LVTGYLLGVVDSSPEATHEATEQNEGIASPQKPEKINLQLKAVVVVEVV
jgi:hypothetical protein